MKVQDRATLFVKKYNFQPEAFMVCPKFEYCSTNKCPLHKQFVKLQSAPEDKERKCKCPKRVRKEIGVYFKLKNIGLNERELNGVRLSIQIQKQSLLTQGNTLKSPQNTITEPNTCLNLLKPHLPEGEISPSGSNSDKQEKLQCS